MINMKVIECNEYNMKTEEYNIWNDVIKKKVKKLLKKRINIKQKSKQKKPNCS